MFTLSTSLPSYSLPSPHPHHSFPDYPYRVPCLYSFISSFVTLFFLTSSPASSFFFSSPSSHRHYLFPCYSYLLLYLCSFISPLSSSSSSPPPYLPLSPTYLFPPHILTIFPYYSYLLLFLYSFISFTFSFFSPSSTSFSFFSIPSPQPHYPFPSYPYFPLCLYSFTISFTF